MLGGVRAALLSGSALLELAPAFDAAGGWTFGAGWSAIDATSMQGTAVATNSQAAVTGLSTVTGAVYQITYTVSGVTTGSVSGRAGFTNAAVPRATNGTYTDTITSGGVSTIGFIGRGPGFDGRVSNVSIKRIS